MTDYEHAPVAVVGLGYVGLPLALAFGATRPTFAFDTDDARLDAYRDGRDPNGEASAEAFQAATQINFTGRVADLTAARYFIIAVPTPIGDARQPDLSAIHDAGTTVGQCMQKGAIVILESTVYPGVTEDVLIPVLEAASGMRCGEDFEVAYSPERVNPGDVDHSLRNTVKVVSARTADVRDEIAALYESVVSAGVFRAKSIRVAEAAKVIENTQRDVNIALMNELSLIFDRLDIDTQAVLEAAGSKWNFVPFRPGLVGGHCIGVDPYYLTYKAESVGYHPEVILSGRRLNDDMGRHVARQTVKQLIRGQAPVHSARVLVLGLSFKENTPDTRNSRVHELCDELASFGCQVLVYDPVADHADGLPAGCTRLDSLAADLRADAVVLAVPHKPIVAALDDGVLQQMAAAGTRVFVDVKSTYPREHLEHMGYSVWRL